MTAPNKMAKRAAAGTLALAVCFTGGVLGASAAQAAPGFAFDQRLGGADRFETAVNASKAAFADGAGDVVVVQDNALADGLTASYLAGVKKAPILYVRQNEVPSVTAAELTRLNAERIYIVGGTGVVSTGVQASLNSNGRTVTRISGADRYATAAAVATSDSNEVGTVFIANGDAPADALAAGPIAYRSTNPILLTRSDVVPPQTAAALNQLQETNRIVLGGNAVVSTSTYADLGATTRLSGLDRQGTAVEIADYATANEGFTKANAALVGSEDRNTADALIAAPLLGQTGTPILFTTRGGLGTTSTNYLTANVDELTGEGYVFGGSAAVPQAIIDEATAAASGEAPPPPPPPPAGQIAITPTDDAVIEAVPQADEEGDPDTADDRLYTVTGLDENTRYRVTLVAAENITQNDGVVSFREDRETGLALAAARDEDDVDTAVAADITAVNGTPTSLDSTQGDITPVNGGLTFRVDGDQFETITPVVYVDGGDSTRLEIDDDGVPTEDYAIGGTIFYQPEQAENGPLEATSEIFEVSKDGDYVIAGTSEGASNLFNYDANDTFFLDDGTELDIDEFEARLTIGDSLAVGTSYRDNPVLSSRFVLANTEPRPLTITDSDATDSSVTLTIDDDDINDGATVEVFYTEDGSADPTVERQLRNFESVTATADEDEDTTGFQITVGNLDFETPYFFFARQVIGDEEGEFSAQFSDATLAEGENAALESLSASVVDDNGLQGEVDGGDVFQVGFNQVLDPIADPGDEIVRVVDGNGESVNLTNGGTPNAGFTLNTVAEEFDGEEFAPGELLTITVAAAGVGALTDRDGNADNNNQSLDYPLTITTQSGITAQVDGETEPWTPADDTDNVLELGGQASEPVDEEPVVDEDAPFITAALLTTDTGVADTWEEVGDVLTVTFSEPVAGLNATTISEADLEAVLGTTVQYAGTTVVNVTGTGATRTFTVATAALTEGIAVDDTVDGTPNALVQDLATPPNNQIANPDDAPTVEDGV